MCRLQQISELPETAIASTKKSRHARDHRRVAVIKSGVNGMGMEIGQVVPGEFHQCGGERFGLAGKFSCEPVGFPLVPAG